MVAARNLPKIVLNSEAMRQVSYFFQKPMFLSRQTEAGEPMHSDVQTGM
jgi:hypothetical protein